MERQKTIKKEFFLEGKGLQTGKGVKVFFAPLAENEGIVFVRRDLEKKPSIRLKDFFDLDTDRRSRIGLGPVYPVPNRPGNTGGDRAIWNGAYVETVEHILAALWGADVDNIKIEMDNSEAPAMDGSAGAFLDALETSGVKEQNAERNFIEIKKPLWVEEKESFLGIFPSNIFKISYVLEYADVSVGRQFFSGELNKSLFREKIARARTFCLKEEAELLLKQGYGKGADFKNTLVMDKSGPIQNTLRFPDEPVRHKVLDLIGDLYLLGKPIKGRIIAIRSGHKLNLELVKKIKACQPAGGENL